MSVSDMVETLLELQDIDGEIEERKSELEELTPQVEAARERLEEVRSRLEEARKELEEAQRAYRSDERSIDAGRETLKRLKERADGVENMKQHRAMKAELATARRNLQQAEEEALGSMQRMEDAKAAVAELEEALEEAREEYEGRSQDVESRRRELEEELSRQQSRREDCTGGLDDEVVALYEQVRKGRTEDALAPLSGNHCGHCFTMVPPQKRKEVRTGERLHRCEGCGVILHAPGDDGSG